jgi:large subunit ribosomal protein L7/L12
MTKEETKETSEEIKVPEKFEKIVQEIEKMSVLDLSELVKILEKKFNVSASAPMMVAQASAGASGESEAGASEEKASYTVELKSVGAQKIEVIKVVRDITQKGLKEAKELVDAAGTAPQVISEDVKKEDAEEMKKKFEAAGAQVELK